MTLQCLMGRGSIHEQTQVTARTALASRCERGDPRGIIGVFPERNPQEKSEKGLVSEFSDLSSGHGHAEEAGYLGTVEGSGWTLWNR